MKKWIWKEWLEPNLAVLLLCAFFTGIVWVSAYQIVLSDYRDAVSRIQAENDRLTLAFEEHVRHDLRRLDEELLLLKAEFEQNGKVTSTILRYYARISTDPLLNQSVMLNEYRQPLASALPVPPNASFNNLPHLDYHVTKDSWELFIGQPFVGRVSGKTSIHVSRRLNRPGGAFAGVVVAAIDPQYFTNFFQRMELDTPRIVRIVGMDGWIRASRDPNEPINTINLRTGGVLFQYMQESRTGHYLSAGNLTNVRRYFSYRVMPDYPLIVQVGIESTAALTPHRSRSVVTYAAAAAVSLLIFGFGTTALLLSRRRLASERRHRLLFETTNSGIMYFDKHGHVLDFNPAAAHILGLSHKDISRRILTDERWKCLQEDGSPLSHEQLPASVAIRTGQPVFQKTVGVFNPVRKGTSWLRTTAIPQFLSASRVPDQVFVSFSDITELVRQERQILHDAMLAQKIQRTLLPPLKPSEYLDMETVFHAYRYVSGDLYYIDWRRNDELVRGYLIDVTGHGMSTALYTSALNVLLHEAGESNLPLRDQLKWLNRQSLKYFEESAFAAAIAFEIDVSARTLSYAGAGIPEFWVRTADQSGPIPSPGLFLGVQQDLNTEEGTLPISVGDVFYFMTDGLTDLLKKREFPSEAGFDDTISFLREASESEECRDDASAICIRIRALPQDTSLSDKWPREFHIDGFGEYQRLRQTLSNILSSVTRQTHSVQEIVLNEALANALECRDGVPRPHHAHLKMNRFGKRFVVRIRTSRIGFAGNTILQRLRSSSAELFDLGRSDTMGRGIPLMLALSDRMTYNAEGTEIFLAWKLSEKVKEGPL